MGLSPDLLAALCLVLVLEGLFLFAFPSAWKRAAAELIKAPGGQLRVIGGCLIVVGMFFLWLVRG